MGINKFKTEPYCLSLSPEDHTYQNIYESFMSLEVSGNKRYGLTVRASAVPEELRSRCRVKTSSESANFRPPPVIGTAPFILFAGGVKPKVDWTSSVSFSRLERLWREAQIRNETPDWIFRQGLSLQVEGVSYEIGQVSIYRDGRVPLPMGFFNHTLVHSVTKVTITGARHGQANPAAD